MAAETPTPDDRLPDEQIASLVRDAFDCEPPRGEFVAALGAKLEAELHTALADIERSPIVTTIPVEGAKANPRGARSARGNSRRSMFALAMAGMVVLAVSIWSSRPSYSWTSMLQALEDQAWIESATDKGADDNVRAWVSQPHRLVIVRNGQDVVWNDLRDGMQSRYQFGSGVLLRGPLDGGRSFSVEQTLLSLLSDTTQQNSQLSEQPTAGADRVTVLSQSWRTVGAGDNRRIELDVILSAGGADAATVHLLLLLDPETQLPLTCQRIDEQAQVTSSVRFSYPDEGPRQLTDVGVPADVVEHQVASADGVPQLATGDLIDPLESFEDTPPPEPPDAEQAVEREIATDEVLPHQPSPAPLPHISLSSEQMSQRIDDLLAGCREGSGITPTPMGDDEEFLRRVYLDLTGRIPTVSECREFRDDVRLDRREQLVESLLARRDHATHLGAVWRKILLPDGVDLSPYGGSSSFEQWLSERFRSNVPYDETVRQLLLAEGRVGESGPILFYAAFKLKAEEIAAQSARAFLGMRLECAQCHDHRFDPRWKQTDFWGFAAFFAQISRPEGKMDVVSPVLRVADSATGEVMLPDTEQVVGPRYPLGDPAIDDPSVPSRREQLAVWLTAPENPHFARATVNRVWALLFGCGLVEPVDDMRLDNPSVCPEVLDELAGYFVSSGFDLRDLFRVIVSSQAYQRTSQAPDDDPSRTALFAQMNIKTLTAEQLYDSISVATRLEPLESDDGSLMRSSNFSRQSFLEQFRAPPGEVTDYQAGIPQALTLMNGGLIQSATDLRSSGILRSLEAPFFTDEQRVDTLYLATLSRLPDESERQSTLEYIHSADGERSTRFSDVLWALLNSAEFALNH